MRPVIFPPEYGFHFPRRFHLYPEHPLKYCPLGILRLFPRPILSLCHTFSCRTSLL
jgi:hypothetical protein